MSRLTEKKFLANFKAIKNINPNYVASKEELMYEKLGKLEDLEEEIGCPLSVLSRALKQDYIYTNSGKHSRLEFGTYGGVWCICYGLRTQIRVDGYKNIWWLKEDKSE